MSYDEYDNTFDNNNILYYRRTLQSVLEDDVDVPALTTTYTKADGETVYIVRFRFGAVTTILQMDEDQARSVANALLSEIEFATGICEDCGDPIAEHDNNN